MLHFFFALLAAGLNLGEAPDPVVAEAPQAETVVTPTAPAPTAETSESITAGTAPSVSIGSGVQIGEGTVIAALPKLQPLPTAPSPDLTALPKLQRLPTAPAPEPTALPKLQPLPTAPSPAPAGPPIPVVPGMNMAVVPLGLTAEPQTPTGKFTTAAEIRPIMDATKPGWVSLREFDGQDVVYVTSIWSWRCGLAAMAISVNNEPMQNWPLPACHMQYGAPNSILDGDGLPFLKFQLGSIQSVSIQLVYDDLTMDAMTYQRRDILAP